MKWVPENELNYRVVKTIKGYVIEKEQLKNIGWMLFPDYEKFWAPLDKHYCVCWHWSQEAKYYQTDGEAVSIAQGLKDRLHEVVYETK